MSAIDFTVLPPPEILRRDVECVRLAAHSSDEALEVRVCPSGLPGIVFQLTENGDGALESISTRTASVPGIALPILFLHGQGAEPSIMRFKAEPYTTIQIVLKPHALFTLFGMDASSLHQGFLAPDQFGAAALEQQLIAAPTNAQRVTLLGAFLAAKLQQTHKRDELIERSVIFIQEHITSVSVKDIIETFHISERQFQKRFARVVGMTPQLYIRVKRINEALRMMNTGQYEKLSDIAYLLHFYDQSHFIREMKAFSWVTPRDIAQKVSEFHSDLAGSSYI